MYARHIDQRGTVFEKAIEVGDAYVLRTKVLYNCNTIIMLTKLTGVIDEGSVTQQQYYCFSKCVITNYGL